MIFLLMTLVVLGQLVSADQKQQLALSSALSNFSQRLYQKVSVDMPNVVYSPYSIHSALNMVSLGARGDTATEIKNTLGIASLGNSVHETYKELIKQMNSVTDVEMTTTNALFLKPYIQHGPDFIPDSMGYYSAHIASIQFPHLAGPEKLINGYIAARTKNKINNLLRPGTQELLSFSTDSVEMMTDDRNVNIKRDDVSKVDVAELPFKGGRFSLYIALPRAVNGITDLEQLLVQPDQADQLFTGLTSVGARLVIPKFKTETMLNLNTPLKEMGITQAFNPSSANFSGITPARIFISEVLQKVLIEVEEIGAVVSAAAAMKVMRLSSGPLHLKENFIADHSFVYFLRDNQTGQILLQGKFTG
ncbi:leukocyte elastase inhibitor-like [Biomphalaria glabrata]|uniref:Leukocyte elastase inhibitor-like n=1 Tax=Biomphalaria glabrata TaxID=6526 RepID=A0A9W2YF47_BIOGL|nr:leukocyte elastase inhibitor-like [Biomphalaria glabrata]